MLQLSIFKVYALSKKYKIVKWHDSFKRKGFIHSRGAVIKGPVPHGTLQVHLQTCGLTMAATSAQSRRP